MSSVGSSFALVTLFFFLCRYRTFVSEDAGPNTLVATVLAKDPDGDGINYSITAGNEDGNFVIDSQKGEASSFHRHSSHICSYANCQTTPPNHTFNFAS